MDTTSASPVNRPSRYGAREQYSTLISTALPKPSARHTRTLLRMRSYFCAPKFCPAKVVMEIPYAPNIIQKKPSTLPCAVQAATVAVPKPLMAV